MVTLETRRADKVAAEFQAAAAAAAGGGASVETRQVFSPGDTIRIKRSNGQDQEVVIKSIDYETRMVGVSWKGSDEALYEKEIQFNNVLMLNRPRKFSAPPASINLQNQAKPDKNNNMIVNKKLEKKFDNSEDMDIHLSPQRPKSSMGDNKKNQIFTKDMKHSFAKPIKLTHNNSNLQRSVSSMSAEVVIDEKKAVNRSKITEKQITDSKKVKTTKRRASIANPRSGLVLKRDSIAPGRRSLAPRMSLGPQNQTSNALRPQTKVKDQGPRAVHKAAAQAIYIDLINEEKENILQCDIRHKHKKKYDRITVAVRKRPMNDNEKKIDGIDIVSILDDERISVHEPKEKVDMTRYIDNSNFRFDYVFGPEISNDSIYKYSICPLLRCVFDGGNATCFVYGQTGSGKTYTIYGSNDQAVPGLCTYVLEEMLSMISNYYNDKFLLYISLFEIYGSKILDLLNNKKSLKILEDYSGKGIVKDLHEIQVTSVDDIFNILLEAIKLRCSGKTSCNDNSSRSHAVLQIALKDKSKKPKLIGKFSLIDLAGNERGQDNINMDLQTRQESSEINRNLLSLKECIRALDKGSEHIPFRECNLTKVLKDCFVAKNCKTCMIAHISPSLSCSEHTLNTLRYTSRVKELPFKGISEKCDTEPSENVPTAPGTNMENVSDGDVDHDAADAAELKARQETEEKEIITEILNDIKSDFGQLISSQEDIMQYLITRLEDRKNTSIERKKRLTKVYKQYCAELIGSKQAILSRLEGIN